MCLFKGQYLLFNVVADLYINLGYTTYTVYDTIFIYWFDFLICTFILSIIQYEVLLTLFQYLPICTNTPFKSLHTNIEQATGPQNVCTSLYCHRFSKARFKMNSVAVAIKQENIKKVNEGISGQVSKSNKSLWVWTWS